VERSALTLRRAGQTETQGVVAIAGGVPVAFGRTRVARFVVPTAAAHDWAGQAFTTRRKAERQKTLRERAARARKTTAGSADSKGVKASRFKG